MPKIKKVRPLLTIMNPRNIPWVMKKFKKIKYVDKVYFKYTKTSETLKNIEEYFLKHKKYTHLIINSDDGAPDYDGIAMLIADVKKYNFPVISGCVCIDKLMQDMSLNLTFKAVTKERKIGAIDRTSYNSLPAEFLELKGIVRVWFQGNATCMIRRDIVEKIGLTTWFGGTGDIQFSYLCWKQHIPQYADLRVYFEHSKYPTVSSCKILVGNRTPKIVAVKASEPIPKRKPAPIIRTIPRKYCDLINFYYGSPKRIKICIVSEFEQKDYFQWFEALRHYSVAPKREYGKWHHTSGWTRHSIQLSSVIMNPSTMKLHSPKSTYWNPIRNADLVFVYCVRHNIKDDDGKPWRWYMLPVWTREFMKKTGKLIAQFDMEFMFLWNRKHIWWKNPIPEIRGKTPRKFFAKNKVLKVADAYFTVLENPPWAKYTKKPIYYMPLPQLFRYKKELRQNCPFYYFNKNKDLKNKTVAIMHHSVKSASVFHTLDNVLNKLDIPVMYFAAQVSPSMNKKKLIDKYPKGSAFYAKLPRETYLEFLAKTYAAIDDNKGYIGWSRFVMECAIQGVPCIGSQKSVKDIFPELYTKHKSYKKQRGLLTKLFTDKEFYEFVVKCGWIRVVQGALSDIHLCTKLLKISFFDLKCDYEDYKGKGDGDCVGLINFLIEHSFTLICRRPRTGEETYDSNSRNIVNQKQWDKLYGQWREIINDKKLYSRCLKIAMAKIV